MRAVLPLAAAIAALASVATAAMAQDNAAAVEALFAEGKKLEAEGKIAEACPKFLASYNLEHRTGTLLNLADCYERVGMYASAWARFVESRTMATRAGQTDRAEFARQHAAALEGRLSRLTIAAPAGVPGLQVTRDATLVDPAAYGVAVPVDPGDHLVVASAPGKLTWRSTAHVAADAPSVIVAVPPLADAPREAEAAHPVEAQPPPAPVAPAAPSPPAAEQPASRSTGRVVLGLSIAGAGVVAAAVGGVLGFVAIGKKNQSEPDCDVGGNLNACYPPGAALRQDAVSAGNAASVLIGSGVAMMAGGLVLWITAPPAAGTPSSGVAFDGRTLRLMGTF
jgi:hypothetical protein